MYACQAGRFVTSDLWLKRDVPTGWFQLESAIAYGDYFRPGRAAADRKCLDVHVDRTKTTSVVHHWTCGPLNKGNQLFCIQAVWADCRLTRGAGRGRLRRGPSAGPR